MADKMNKKEVILKFSEEEAESVGFALRAILHDLKGKIDGHSIYLLARMESAYRKLSMAPSSDDLVVFVDMVEGKDWTKHTAERSEELQFAAICIQAKLAGFKMPHLKDSK